MAKKGGQQQLQADISSDEEFEKFLDRPGLLVLDVYSEWCGPCLGMVGSLKKIKLELGGDNLHLAICKSDTISYLKRFNKKSEPTWLFVTNGKAVNLMFGTNVPKLMKLIASELSLLGGKAPRPNYNIAELQPEEVQRRKVKEDAIAEAIRIELAAKEKKRRDYLNYVTDSIMENLPDIGVTVFGPQVNRDMFKKVMEPADALKMQCKDRRVQYVLAESFDVVHYASHNPIEPDVLQQMEQKELLLCYWKLPEDSRSVADVLMRYAHELTKSHTEPADDGHEEEHVIPPIISPIDVEVEYELRDDEECVADEPPPPPPKSKAEQPDAADEVEEEAGEGGGEGEAGEGAAEAEQQPELDLGLDLEDGEEEGGEGEGEEVEAAPEVFVEAPKRMCKKKIRIPPIWVPKDHRTHAALIYVFFRAQTAPFLPPDPVPEPPHIVMAFDAYKRNDLIGVAERHRDDVPLYGFFTSDDVDEAQYIANSLQKYAQQPHTAGDKIVLKVNKATSHTMLALATYGPSYVSPNTVLGREEALRFFPATYKTAEQERLEREELESQEPKKKRKSKKHSMAAAAAAPAGDDSGHVAAAVDADGAQEESGAASSPGEEGTTTSGEDSGDSIPAEASGGDDAPAAN